MALAVLLTGCTYVPNRLRDFADMGRVSIGPCLGLGVDVKASGLFHPSLGVTSSAIKVGWDTRDCFIFWREKEAYFPVSVVSQFVRELEALDALGAALPCFYARDAVTALKVCTSVSRLFYSPPPGNRSSSRIWGFVATVTDFEVGVSALLLSARVGLNAAEVVDFLFGLWKLDPAGDDPK